MGVGTFHWEEEDQRRIMPGGGDQDFCVSHINFGSLKCLLDMPIDVRDRKRD